MLDFVVVMSQKKTSCKKICVVIGHFPMLIPELLLIFKDHLGLGQLPQMRSCNWYQAGCHKTTQVGGGGFQKITHQWVSILKNMIHTISGEIPDSVTLNYLHIDSTLSCCININEFV